MIWNNFIESLTKEETKKLLNLIPAHYIGDQWFPIMLNGKTNTEQLRKKLLDSRLSGERKLMSYCKTLFNDLLLQYPFIIEDRDYWVGLIKDMNLSSEYIKRGIFYVDGFSPSRNLAIEADYPSTHDKLYDIAKDTYLKNIAKINVERVNLYGQDDKLDKKIEKQLTFYKDIKHPTRLIDYSKLAISQYLLYKYPQLYDSLEKISLGKRPGPTYYKFCKWIGRKPL